MKFLKLNTLACALLGCFYGSQLHANEQSLQALTVEEQRIEQAQAKIPKVTSALSPRVEVFTKQLNDAANYTVLMQLVIRHGTGVWQDAIKRFNQVNDADDRALYWARLQMTKQLRLAKAFKQLLPHQQQKLLWRFELLSRGQQDVKFDKKTDKKILLTGFDPFFLDRNIDQSNPSGVVAMALDDVELSLNGVSAEVEVLMIPVRFADFDQGMIETLLTPYFKDQRVDMVVTVSMGREDFDLERFPGLRRSAKAPDNLNIYTGANAQKPLVPRLDNKKLSGPEFVEFSLPVAAMTKAQGRFKVNDNHNVETIQKGKFAADSLSSLSDQTSVQGAGGGYLSNEISYRSILIRNQYQPKLPVGHIHTPRIKAFAPEVTKDIVKQTKQMLTLAIEEI